MKGIAVLGTLIILFQMIFSFYQIRYYNRFIRDIVKRYENKPNYRLDTEIVKKTLGSLVIVVVTDIDSTIVESYYYHGFTIFSKFREFKEINGRTLNKYLSSYLENRQTKLKRKAIEQLVNKKLETVTPWLRINRRLY